MSQKIQCKKNRCLKKILCKKNSMSQKIQCKNIQSQHPGNLGEAIDSCINSSSIQPIKLRSIGHVMQKQEGDEAQVSSGRSMAQNTNDGASVKFWLDVQILFSKLWKKAFDVLWQFSKMYKGLFHLRLMGNLFMKSKKYIMGFEGLNDCLLHFIGSWWLYAIQCQVFYFHLCHVRRCSNVFRNNVLL